MTPLEKDCLDMFLSIRDYLTGGGVRHRYVFMDMMGEIVKIIKRLEAHASGCPTGTHFGGCSCRPAVVGRPNDWKHRRRNVYA
jgi:hypothetical protein